MPKAANVRVDIYDVRGARVRTLAAGDFPAGRHQLVWDGRDGAGRTRPGGVYFVHARIGEFENRHKVLKLE